MELRKALQLNPMLRWVGALIAGIVAADGLAHCVSANCWQWLLVGTVGLLLATYLLHEERRVWPQCLLLAAATFLLGATLQGRAQERLSVMVPNEAVEYEAVVASEPQVKGKTARMDLLVTRVGDRPLPRPVSVRASLLRDTVTARWQSLHVGCGIRAYARFERLRPMGQRGRFDYIRWAQVHGYQAQTFIYYSHWEPAVVSIRALSIMQRARLKLLGFRQNLLRRFHALGLDDQQYAVVAAMALGDKSGLSQATKDSYAISGASHVLALSGLHLGIVYGLLTWVFGMRRRWLWVGQGLTLTAVWSYVMLVGFPTSVVRSATMLTVCSVCLLLRRRRVSINTLALAALLMLMANPLNLWDVGFQLSFLAVLGILVYQRAFYQRWHPSSRLLRWAWGMTTLSLAAQLTTAPLVAYYFGRFSCYFLLTNFLVVPAAIVILYTTVALLLTLPFAVVGQGVAWVLAMAAGALNQVLTTMATWPGASVEGINLTLWQVVALYVMLLSITVVVSYAWRLRPLQVLDAFNPDEDLAGLYDASQDDLIDNDPGALYDDRP